MAEIVEPRPSERDRTRIFPGEGPETLVRNWWAVALRGIVAVLFGLLLLVWPVKGLMVLIVLYGAYALADGVFAIVSAIRAAKEHRSWGVFVLEGVLGIAAGLVTFFYPGLTAFVLTYIIAFWAVATGILELIAAVRLRHSISNEWLLGLAGVLSIALGIFIFMRPAAGALGIVGVLGIYALLFGFSLIGLGFRLKSLEARRPAHV